MTAKTEQPHDSAHDDLSEDGSASPFEREVDSALERRDQLRGSIRRLEQYRGDVPSEVEVQQSGIDRHRHELAEIEHTISMLRGDFAPGDPAARHSESPDERALRILRRCNSLRGAGVRAFRQQLAKEEGCSVSNIRKILDRAATLLANGPKRRE